jgi:hypothetical protein
MSSTKVLRADRVMKVEQYCIDSLTILQCSSCHKLTFLSRFTDPLRTVLKYSRGQTSIGVPLFSDLSNFRCIEGRRDNKEEVK